MPVNIVVPPLGESVLEAVAVVMFTGVTVADGVSVVGVVGLGVRVADGVGQGATGVVVDSGLVPDPSNTAGR